MNPTIHQELITARIAVLHRQATRGSMARAATQARRAHGERQRPHTRPARSPSSHAS